MGDDRLGLCINLVQKVKLLLRKLADVVGDEQKSAESLVAGTTSGYPTCRRGDKNTYVLILQDALNALGYSTKTLDGAFGKNTYDALRAAQRSFNLTADGVCGCNTWKKLTSAVVGIGRTKTVID